MMQKGTKRKCPTSSSLPPNAVHRVFNEHTDVVSGVLFCFLNLSEHVRLARVSRSTLAMSCLPLPPKKTIAPWRKHVELPREITDWQLRRLLSYAHLTSLALLGTTTDANVNLFSLKNEPLQLLSLLDSGEITNDGLFHLKELPLQHLTLGNCINVTDGGLWYLKGLPLSHLTLGNCIFVTDDGLLHLKGLQLTHLDLKQCHGIGTANLSFLMTKCPYNTSIWLARISQTTA